jgi:hypothetical protein
MEVQKMTDDSGSTGDLRARAAAISRFKKEHHLQSLSEDSFRDQVVRPLFLRQGLKDGRDVCGPTEAGKDVVFISVDALGIENAYVVQTKKGNLNLGKKAGQNLIEAITQLRTALSTKVHFLFEKVYRFPTRAILCASGTINETARHHIQEEIQDARLAFMDGDDLIPKIDEYYPEFWFGMDAEIHPYLRALRRSIESAADYLVFPGTGTSKVVAPVTDAMFVPLRIYRTRLAVKKQKRGQQIQVPKIDEMPIDGVLNQRSRLVLLLGDAGAGKSTAIRRLAYTLSERALTAKSDIHIPILLRASEIAQMAVPSLLQACTDATAQLTGSRKSPFTSNDLQQGNVVVFIDALDELAAASARQIVVTSVKEFHSNYPQCRVIVTSRDYAIKQLLAEIGEFEQLRVTPMNFRQAQMIVKRLQKGRGLPEEASKEIIRRLQDVHGLELNPLLVTIFAATTDASRRDIPANITELFKKFTELMLGRWDETKGLGQQYQAPLKDLILTRVTFEMHRRRVTKMDIGEFKSLIVTELEKRGHAAEVNVLADEILVRSGLFRVLDNQVEFRHLLIQEFFAGRGISSKENLEILISDEWWKRAIVFYFGEHPSDAEGLKGIMNSMSTKPAKDLYLVSTTLGLALQACYFVEVKDKVEILRAVIDGLARAKDATLLSNARAARLPVSMFIMYYLYGRDSVASSILKDSVDDVIQGWENGGLSQPEVDNRMFWLIVGLIETGAFETCEKMVENFHPSDAKLLLGVHLGCFLTRHLRIATKDEKERANRIGYMVSDRIDDLRRQLLKEFKSELLEVQRGQIKSLEQPREEATTV